MGSRRSWGDGAEIDEVDGGAGLEGTDGFEAGQALAEGGEVVVRREVEECEDDGK